MSPQRAPLSASDSCARRARSRREHVRACSSRARAQGYGAACGLHAVLSILALASGCAAPSAGASDASSLDASHDEAPQPEAGPGDTGVSTRDAGPTYVRRAPWALPGAPVFERGTPLLGAFPWLATEANPWRTNLEGAASDPSRMQRGAVALGNGYVFAFVGIGEPDVATVHEAVGLGYDRGEAFFSDLQLRVARGAEELRPRAQYQWRVNETAIAVTLSRYEGFDLLAVDAAPFVRPSWASAPEDRERAVVRQLELHSTRNATDTRPLTVSLVAHESYTVDAGGALRQTRDGVRSLRVVAQGPGASIDRARRSAVLTFDALAPGQSAQGRFVLAFSVDRAQEQQTLASLEADVTNGWLGATRERWRARVAEGAVLEAPLEAVVGLVDALRVSVLVQQAANGAVAPMSRYTRTWLRDTIGPVLSLAALGHHDAVARALAYQWSAVVAAGDLRNSLSAALEVPASPPADPGFASLAPLEGRVRAEGPSWVVLAHDELARWTGDRATLAARYGLLVRAATKQALDASDLLPFSGDETYRVAMAATMGLPLSEPFEQGFRSLEASALLSVALARLAGHATALGRGDDAATMRALEARVRAALDRTYERASDGGLLPYLRDGSGLAPELYEDASLAPAWLGYLDASPARLRRSVRAVARAHANDQGFPVAPLAASVARVLPPEARGGLYTGMAPAMFLSACARGDLAEGALAFDGLSRAASSTGTFEEYQTLLDHGAFSIAYDPVGTLGEITARYRPWEGGIALRALLDWLFGLEPRLLPASTGDAPTIELSVAPHVSPRITRYALRGVRLGDARVDVVVFEQPSGADRERVLELRRAREGTQTRLRVRLGVRAEGELRGVTLDGVPIDPSSLVIERDEGRVRFDTAPVELGPGEARVLRVQLR